MMLKYFQQAWRPAVEILILTVGIYYATLFFRRSRGAPVVTGFLLLLLASTVVSTALDLRVLRWLLGTFFAFFAVAVLVIFQPELRRMLAELGNLPFVNTARDRTP